jgi:hypothetical protein
MEELKREQVPASWQELADVCERWEALPQHLNSNDVFFSCPVYEGSLETFNCLFFEILHSLERPSEMDLCDLSAWLNKPKALEAAQLFRILCRRSYRQGHDEKSHPRAAISRHWYNTLNQELSELSKTTPQDLAQIRVQALFGDVTTAGEWYLAVPSHAASPEVGLRLIEYLTAPQHETARVELGVGLPTRTAYYQTEDTRGTSVSRYFSFSREEVYRLLKNAVRRSNFRHYQRFARNISSHLKWLLEIHDPTEGLGAGKQIVMSEIRRTMKSLVSNIHFLTHDPTGVNPGDPQHLTTGAQMETPIARA